MVGSGAYHLCWSLGEICQFENFSCAIRKVVLYTVFYNVYNKHIFGLPFMSWHSAPKIHGISNMVGLPVPSCNDRQLLGILWMGAAIRRTNQVLDG